MMPKWMMSCLIVALLPGALAACQADTALPAPHYVETHRLEIAGPYKHVATGDIFPDHVGKALRTDLLQYDEAGLDISANYVMKGESGDLVLSVYVFPITRIAPNLTPWQRHQPALCRQAYEATKLEVALGLDDIYAVTDERYSSPHPDWTKGGHFAITAKRVTTPTPFNVRPPLVSEFYLFCSENAEWLLKYRITYSEKMSDKELISALIADVPTK